MFSGVLQALPIVLGYLPLGFAYGALANDYGLSLWATLSLSLFVFAGAAQFIAITFFATNQPVLNIVVTTFIVNLRMMFMSAALTPYLSRWSKLLRILFSFQLSDETFAVHSVQFSNHVPDKSHIFSVNMTAYLAWAFASYLGYAGRALLTDLKPFGFDFALPALFIALLVIQIKNKKMAGIGILAGLLTVLFRLLGLESESIIFATIIGATLGMVWEWKKA